MDVAVADSGSVLFHRRPVLRACRHSGAHGTQRQLREQEVARQLERLVKIRTQEANARAEAMEALYRQAEEASRLKTEFVATMSHEFLSPLHVILGYADLLLQGSWGRLDNAAQELVDRMRLNGRRLLAMVTNVLDLAKVDAGAAPLFLAPVDLSMLADDVTDPAALPRAEGVTVRVRVEPDMPMPITDGHKLRTLLGHLLANAVKFTPSGEVALSVALDRTGEHITFTVKDTGIGMRPEDLKTIFEDFRQIDGSLQRRFEGLGLGLALVRRYASLLGGTLDVASQPGAGSCFTFSLPLTPVTTEAPAEFTARQVA